MRVVGGGIWLALKLSLAWFVINMVATLANLYGFVAGIYRYWMGCDCSCQFLYRTLERIY